MLGKAEEWMIFWHCLLALGMICLGLNEIHWRLKQPYLKDGSNKTKALLIVRSLYPCWVTCWVLAAGRLKLIMFTLEELKHLSEWYEMRLGSYYWWNANYFFYVDKLSKAVSHLEGNQNHCKQVPFLFKVCILLCSFPSNEHWSTGVDLSCVQMITFSKQGEQLLVDCCQSTTTLILLQLTIHICEWAGPPATYLKICGPAIVKKVQQLWTLDKELARIRKSLTRSLLAVPCCVKAHNGNIMGRKRLKCRKLNMP